MRYLLFFFFLCFNSLGSEEKIFYLDYGESPDPIMMYGDWQRGIDQVHIALFRDIFWEKAFEKAFTQVGLPLPWQKIVTRNLPFYTQEGARLYFSSLGIEVIDNLYQRKNLYFENIDDLFTYFQKYWFQAWQIPKNLQEKIFYYALEEWEKNCPEKKYCFTLHLFTLHLQKQKK